MCSETATPFPFFEAALVNHAPRKFLMGYAACPDNSYEGFFHVFFHVGALMTRKMRVTSTKKLFWLKANKINLFQR